MGQRKEIKLENIAKEFNTSTVTVSNALNGKKGVGEELRRKILDKAVELGYHLPQDPVKDEKRLYYIGVIVSENCMKKSSTVQMEIYKEIVREAEAKKCLTSLVIMSEEVDERERLFDLLADLKMDGFIFIGGTRTDTVDKFRRKMKIPIVGIDSYNWSESMPLGRKNDEIHEVILTVYESENNTDTIAKTSMEVLMNRMN